MLAPSEIKAEVPDQWDPTPPTVPDHTLLSQDLHQMKQEVIKMIQSRDKYEKEMTNIRTMIQSLAENQVKWNEESRNCFSKTQGLISTVSMPVDPQVPVMVAPKAVIPAAKPTPTMAPAPPPREKTVRKVHCIFCHQVTHDFTICPMFPTSDKKRAIMGVLQRCLKCFNPLDSLHTKCRKIVCSICNEDSHRAMFCLKGGNISQKKPKKLIKKCDFCNSQYHFSTACPTYFIGIPANKRKFKLWEENRCFRCFQPNTNQKTRTHENCPNEGLICIHCLIKCNDPSKAAHHHFLCEASDIVFCNNNDNYR